MINGHNISLPGPARPAEAVALCCFVVSLQQIHDDCISRLNYLVIVVRVLGICGSEGDSSPL